MLRIFLLFLAISANMCAHIYVPGVTQDNSNSIATLWTIDVDGNLINTSLLGKANKTSSIFGSSNSANRVYITGIESEAGIDIATLWVADNSGNLIKTTSLSSLTESAEASEIIVSGRLVYILGFEKVSGIQLATLWITDLEGNHISTIHLSSNSSLAEFFIKQGTLLYISGYETHNGIKTAMLWMRDSYGQFIKTVTLGNAINQSTTYGIVSLENKIYVAGKETQSTNKTALLWILSAQGEIIGTSSLFTSQDFIIAELLPFSQKIYLNADIGFGYPINASIFIIDPNGNIVKTTSLSNEDNTFILAGSKSLRNQLYVLGFEKQNNQAISSLSIINSNGDLIKKEFLGEFNENYTFTFAVTSINNRIYVAGTKTNGSINNASLWILDYQGNILNTSLLDNSSNTSSASFILSFDSLRSIFQAIKSFSPVKEQKGL